MRRSPEDVEEKQPVAGAQKKELSGQQLRASTDQPFEQGGGSQASLHHFPGDKKNFERIDKRKPLTRPLSAWPIAALLLVLLYLVFGLMEHWLSGRCCFLVLPPCSWLD
jgi:hypothetical protein